MARLCRVAQRSTSTASNKVSGVLVSSMMRGRLWKIGDRIFDLSRQGLIMGVLNVTPDSFFDGGNFFDAETAVEHGLRMAAEGGHIVDVGGESTRPGAEAVALEEELRRVIPVIEQLHRKSEVIISIDTSKGTPQTMQIAPQYTNVVSEVSDFFRQLYGRAIGYSIDPMVIAFDPGIGFGKTLEHNLELLAQLERLRACDRPIVIGVSRKSFLGKLINSPQISDRLAPAVALTSLLRTRGADVLRVHDVKENVNALKVTDAILQRVK